MVEIILQLVVIFLEVLLWYLNLKYPDSKKLRELLMYLFKILKQSNLKKHIPELMSAIIDVIKDILHSGKPSTKIGSESRILQILQENNVQKLYNKGRYKQAILLGKAALEVVEERRKQDHPDVAMALNNFAVLLHQAQANYAEAKPLYERALMILEKTLGPYHLYVATVLTNFAGLYQAQGDYAEAKRLYERALEILEKSLGSPDYPNFAAALNNLAELYQAQGDYGEAKQLYERALEILEKTLGSDHPDVATILNNLAELYQTRGDYAEAVPLLRRAWSILKKSSDSSHPNMATVLNNLARSHQAQDGYVEATLLYECALEILGKSLGSDHPRTKQVKENLGRLRGE